MYIVASKATWLAPTYTIRIVLNPFRLHLLRTATQWRAPPLTVPFRLPDALSYLVVGSLAVATQAAVKRDRTHTQGTDGSGCSSARGHIVTGVRHFVAVRCWIYFELLMSLFVKAVSA